MQNKSTTTKACQPNSLPWNRPAIQGFIVAMNEKLIWALMQTIRLEKCISISIFNISSYLCCHLPNTARQVKPIQTNSGKRRTSYLVHWHEKIANRELYLQAEEEKELFY